MHEIPAGLEQKAFISIEGVFFAIVRICQVANVLQFSNGKQPGFLTVCMPDTSTARLLGYLSDQLQPLTAKQPRRQMSWIQHPHPISFSIYFFSPKAGTEIAFQNSEILQETKWPFFTLVRKLGAGRGGSKQAPHGWSSSLEVFAHREQCKVWTSWSTE